MKSICPECNDGGEDGGCHACRRKKPRMVLNPQTPQSRVMSDDDTSGQKRLEAKFEGDSRCVVCSNRVHTRTDNYMVEDSVWRHEAELSRYDNAHLPCLEKLIKRSLVFSDFIDFPINDNIRWALAVRGETAVGDE